ncbi:MAG: hydrogenase expression/formation protein HypE [Acidobacteriota bacterium]|nr:MAG: hydrogenase expression/formation protein HypE [Acidobacteriota bacterium]
MADNGIAAATCPIPISKYPQVMLAHGGGGKLMHQLIEGMFVSSFENPMLSRRHDGAVFDVDRGRMAFTTDSYVVNPIFFPGGDIGSLAVNGTVNDLAVCGARPLCLSTGFIIEEGFGMEDLWRVVSSMKRAADAAGVVLATGDTKVVDRGKGDGIFINTAGVGVIPDGIDIGPHRIGEGDAVILSGDLGRHGIAIMAAREGLEFETTLESDCAPLADAIFAMFDRGVRVNCMRDLTRGGLASALVELSEASGHAIRISESAINVEEDVRGACEILGFDPMYLANEGRFIAFVNAEDADLALDVLSGFEAGNGASLIGRVGKNPDARVVLESSIGADRIVDMFSGEQLPRIC